MPKKISFKQLVQRRCPVAVWDNVLKRVVYGSGMDKTAPSWKTAYRRMNSGR